MGGLVEQDNWQRVRHLFDQVCDLPAEQWEPRLHQLSSDAGVVDERLRLLQARGNALLYSAHRWLQRKWTWLQALLVVLALVAGFV